MKKLLFLLLASAAPLFAQGTFTANTCNYADVNTLINGPTHTAVNGDTIQIPAGTCTWSSQLVIPTGIGITVIGAGAANTNIIDNVASSIFLAKPAFGNSLYRLSSFTLTEGTSVSNPIVVLGTCAAGGCPNMRIDNISFLGWNAANFNEVWMVREDNMWGVVDHNTICAPGNECTRIQSLVNMSNSNYAGVGQFGDNSWAQSNSLGTANALYLENNIQWGGLMTDCDSSGGTLQQTGGCRYVGRFNEIHDFPLAFGVHGTETTGRVRGGRQAEIYNNNLFCSGNCDAAFGFRSAVVYDFNNAITLSAGAGMNKIMALNVYRTWSSWFPWGACNGESPFDTNDGGTLTAASTFTSVGTTTVTDNTQTWTVNQFAIGAGGKFYTLYNASTGQFDDIISNTATTLTLQQSIAGQSWGAGNTYYINGTTMYATGTLTSVSGTTFTDTSKSWTVNQWFVLGNPYSFVDITAVNVTGVEDFGDVGWEISASTANSYTSSDYSFNGLKGTQTIAAGDTYVILRSSGCLDQPARSKGTLYTGVDPVVPTSAVNQPVDPIYEWGDSRSGPGGGPNLSVWSQSLRLIANRDWYSESVSQAAQSSPTSPFNGTSGAGHGIFANRPTTCTTGVVYWATDQGSWNNSGSGGQGQLFKCTATNVWTLAYTPFTYPHPLTNSTTAAIPICSPVSGFILPQNSITCSTTSTGAIMCYTLNGVFSSATTPVTNGTSGCTTGTLYSGPITLTQTLILNIVAGGNGFGDSSPAVYSYTLPGAPSIANFVMLISAEKDHYER